MLRDISALTTSVIDRLEAAGKFRAVEKLREVKLPQGSLENDVRPSPSPTWDAVKLDIRPRAGGVQEAPNVGDVKPLDPPQSIFYPGATIEGSYKDGKFSTNAGVRGTYESIPGHVKFKVDGFVGYLTNGGTEAVAYKASTGEAYKMKVEIGRGTYKVSDIEAISSEQWTPAEGQTPLVEQGSSPNVKFRIGQNGMFGVRVMGDSSGETLYTGQGFLGPNGTYILALSNGSTVQGHYAWSEDGKLQIYDRHQI